MKVFVLTVKPVLSSHSKRRPKIGFKTDYRLMQVKSIAECILQYVRPSLSKTFVLSIFEWPLKTGFTVLSNKYYNLLIQYTQCSAVPL